jgi:hypothetical protein
VKPALERKSYETAAVRGGGYKEREEKKEKSNLGR